MFTKNEIEEINKIKSMIGLVVRSRLMELPDKIHSIILEDGIVSGGVSASIFNGEKVNDFDIYLKDEKNIAIIKELIKDKSIQDNIADVNPKYMAFSEIEGKMVSANAITFNNDIQLITMSTADSRKYFDFIHCLPYYDFKTAQYHISEKQYWAIKNKKLIRNGDAKITQYRIEKFQKRGWSYEQ